MLYFDEAGYTGPDLTNVQQPYFTMASVCITDEDVELIKADIEYAKWGTELHFANMYTNPQGRAVLNKLFAHPLMIISIFGWLMQINDIASMLK